MQSGAQIVVKHVHIVYLQCIYSLLCSPYMCVPPSGTRMRHEHGHVTLVGNVGGGWGMLLGLGHVAGDWGTLEGAEACWWGLGKVGGRAGGARGDQRVQLGPTMSKIGRAHV